MYKDVQEALQQALDNWEMMQTTSGDEGADWAERFERNFYVFIEVLEKWFTGLKPQPKDLDEAEEMREIREIKEQLPVPLELNFITELENIMDGVELSRYD